jgi:hypothetical protein
VQIEVAEVVPYVNDEPGAFEVAASATGPDPYATVAGTVTANAIAWVPTVIVSVFVTGVVTAA